MSRCAKGERSELSGASSQAVKVPTKTPPQKGSSLDLERKELKVLDRIVLRRNVSGCKDTLWIFNFLVKSRCCAINVVTKYPVHLHRWYP